MTVQYTITAADAADAVKQIAQWHRYQAELAMSRAQVTGSVRLRMAHVSEASFHNNAAEFLEGVKVEGAASREHPKMSR